MPVALSLLTLYPRSIAACATTTGSLKLLKLKYSSSPPVRDFR